MNTTLAAEWHIEEPQLRVAESDSRAALGAILGQPVIAARARLRFGPGRTCESVARLLDRAIVRAEAAGLDPELLVVADGSAQSGEDIVRVRRKAHGVADWIHSPTCRVQITLRPAGLHATASTDLLRPQDPTEPPDPAEPPAPPVPAAAAEIPAVPAEAAGERVTAVREALSDVIDPDLGVNIVDLGFVRAVTIEGQTAVIAMTLTSAACPLTGVMENQIRAALAPLGCIKDFRVAWQWTPAWRPADMTDSGREQLRAIGFTI
jgi:metal-sulfur cluster biosynthetic enzyme/ribosomal protein L22